MKIRAENKKDFGAVNSINLAAFPTEDEAKLVAQLREQAQPTISLVAELDGVVLGHILFSPVTLDTNPTLQLMGLAPMAVLPEFQRKGIGSALIEAGLTKCSEMQCAAVAVLGHPDYYPKFGFKPSTHFSIKSEYDVPANAFMLVELTQGSLADCSGTISYHEEFGKLGSASD